MRLRRIACRPLRLEGHRAEARAACPEATDACTRADAPTEAARARARAARLGRSSLSAPSPPP
ncbi:hypothetical protein [Streptomyces fungicidicus]|uniref:hypothetical protein n=1 Tax=Streptomyces fungicidicus TaxID=68203 RepID=UPI0036874781